MKKVISMLLCIVMCASVFTSTVAPVSAASTAGNYMSVSNTGFADDLITYTISLKPNQTKVTGAIIYAVYDATALQVEQSGAAGSVDANDEVVPSVNGMYASGAVDGVQGMHAIAFVNGSGYNVGSAQAKLFQITFKAISQDRLNTTVNFKCVEYLTDDGDDSNNINKTTADAAAVFATHTFHPLSIPSVKEVNSYLNNLKVVWNMQPGADYYDVYRKAEKETSWTLVKSDVTDTFWVDPDAQTGTEYTYTIAAGNRDGETEYNPNGVAGLNFGNIETMTVTENAEGRGADVSWSALTGSNYYEVYRKLAESGEDGWQLIKTLSGTSFTDTTVGSGITYNYKVRAFKNSTTNSNVYSADMICETPSFKFISAPVSVVKNTFGGIEVGFIPSNGADRFVIEKKIGNGGFVQFAEVLNEEITETKHVIIDADVVPGETYTYAIQAFSDDLESKKATPDAVTRLSNTTLTDISNVNGGVKLSWNAVSDATSYDIYRKTTASNAVFRAVGNSTSTSYTDIEASSGTTYVYSVVAKNSSGNGDYATNELQITHLNQPIVKSIISNLEGIKLEWYGVNGAESYNIYRTDSTGTSLIGNTADTVYTNLLEDIELDAVYYYSVEAISGDNKSSKDSTGVEGSHFGVVDGLKVTTSSTGAVLTWTKISAETYIVYRRTVGETSWGDPIATDVSTNSYTDKDMASGVAYEYKVNAKKGNSVADMVCDTVTAKILHIPEIEVRNSGKGIEISIVENIQGADKYVIERAVGSKYSQVAAIEADGYLSYIDEDTEPKETYKYRAYAVANATEDSAEIKSGYSPVVRIERVGAPTIASIENEIAGVYFTWNEVDTATEYQILRKTGKDGIWKPIDTITENDDGDLDTEYLDMEVDGGVKYYYTVSATTEDGGNTGFDDTGEGITFVETPDLVSIKNTSTGISFTWDKVPGAAKYAVYRKSSSSGWKNIATTTKTTYLDTEALDFRYTYQYTVRAVTSDNSRGYYDEEGLSASPRVFVTLSNYSSGVQVKWNKMPGATKYTIYRKYGSGGWKAIKSVSSSTLSYKDSEVNKESGKTYSYTVRAVNGSKASNYNTYTIKRLSNPKVTLSNYSSGVQLKWGKVAGASKYVIYRRYGSGGWKALKTVSSSTLSYKDTSVNKQGGKTYSYTVRAVSGSYTSAFTTYSIKRLYTPKVTLSNYASGVQVKWGKVAGASKYIIYRKYGSGGWKALKTVGASTLSYKDTGVNKQGGKTYSYTVKAVSGSSTSAFTTYSIKRLYTPTLSSAKSLKTGVQFAWKPVTGASGYYVYRKTTGGWTKVATVKGGKTVKYLDKKAKKGVTYTYTVKAYSGNSTSAFNTKGLKCKDKY